MSIVKYPNLWYAYSLTMPVGRRWLGMVGIDHDGGRHQQDDYLGDDRILDKHVYLTRMLLQVSFETLLEHCRCLPHVGTLCGPMSVKVSVPSS